MPDQATPSGDSRSLMTRRAKMPQTSVSAPRPRTAAKTPQPDSPRLQFTAVHPGSPGYARAVRPVTRTPMNPGELATLKLLIPGPGVVSASARRGCTQQEPLSLLTGWLVSLRSGPGVRQRLAELVLSEHLVRLQVLKGTRASDRDAHGGGAD